MTSEQKPTSDEIHLPDPSYQPILLAFGILLIAAGVLFSPIISGIGIAIMLVAIAGWAQENRAQARQEE